MRAAGITIAIVLITTSAAFAQAGTLFVEGDSVGIGTATPNHKLHVSGAAGDTQVRVSETSGTAAARNMFVLENYGGLKFSMFNSLNSTTWNFNAQANFNIDLVNNPGTEFQVQQDGDVVIGGSLTTASSTVPDYVFDPGYELLPIDGLSAFIAQNGHLPNVPSAEEIGATGQINLSEFQMKLLEKIEELTLYTIDQHETISALSERLQALERELSESRSHESQR